MSQQPTLNDPVRIGGLDLPNRVIMAPLTRARAGASGVPGPLNVEYYVQRASAGLIIAEATNVGPLSCAFEGAPGIWRPDQVEGWRGRGGRPRPQRSLPPPALARRARRRQGPA